ncbi:MAG: hypothetical protein Q7U85_07955 [Rhodocyclaceae bacterium]|nr:hypothetical protein [Rhodocyclaceae bacterium]
METRLDNPPPAGILIHGPAAAARGLQDRLDALGMAAQARATALPDNAGTIFRLNAAAVDALAPDLDTIWLCKKLALDPSGNGDDLEREILISLLLAPQGFAYRNYAELASAVRVRKNIVAAARKTTLAFDTSDAAERPGDCWTYSRECGFTVRPGKSLIEALQKATQPEVSGKLHAFSCYRATEYVILLGMAEELATCNPALLASLQRQWEALAIKSGRFHETFLVEYGSMDEPVPPHYYVPGDRVWFRNPDDFSSDVTGYEGSWVFYLGGGLFSNFWQRNQPYTLTGKCLEIYHWRHGVYRDSAGELCMDEAVVAARVAASMNDPGDTATILRRMMRWREPHGVYADGGCIDTSREYPRSICPGAPALVLPDA